MTIVKCFLLHMLLGISCLSVLCQSGDPRLKNSETAAQQTHHRVTPRSANNLDFKSVLPGNFTEGFNEAQFISIMEGEGCFEINSIQVNTVHGNSQIGTFSNGIAGSNMEIDEGIVLTTGSVAESFTSNSLPFTSIGGSGAGEIVDPDLDALANTGLTTHDESIIIIDFEVVENITGFEIPFQFASEEYNESVCSNFNDVFAIFISGNGINGQIPLSLVPGTDSPVTINNINNGTCGIFGNTQTAILTNTHLHIDNSSAPFPIDMEYDGITTRIMAAQKGLKAGNYQIKIAIADVGDGSYDSAVFLGNMKATSGGVSIACTCLDNPLGDPLGDCDGDGVLNGDEASADAALQPCNPNPLAIPLGDCDGDGILNQDESSVAAALNPCDPDPSALKLGDCDNDGIVNGEDECPTEAGIAPTGCPDFDGDGVLDRTDLDDDNDGILDIDEQCVFTPEKLAWHGFAANNMTNPAPNDLSVTGNPWRNAYSDETFTLPFIVEGRLTAINRGMIGITPSAAPETTGWNDGSYKFQIDAVNGMFVRHGSTTSGWHQPSLLGRSFRLEADADGTMRYYNGDNLIYTGSIPTNTAYELTMTRGSFYIEDFRLQELKSSCVDADGDGMPNHLDLDADGDGCYDAIESGANAGNLQINGQFNGGVDANGVPLLANGGLTFDPNTLDNSVQAINCCISNALNDCDGDGYSNSEETTGICGFIGNPADPNSPFPMQTMQISGSSNATIFRSAGENTNQSLIQGVTANLVIPSGNTLTLSSDLTLRDVIVESGATLNLNGFRLTVRGDLTLDGTFIHNLGHIHMLGDCQPRNINGNKTHNIYELTVQNPFGVTLRTDINVSGSIYPEQGTFDLNNQDVVLLSFLAGSRVETARIAEIKSGASVDGEITLQRFVESTEDGYRLIGSPIKNLTIADLDDDIVTTGFTGSDYPSHLFTNVKYYDETQRPGGTQDEGFLDVNSVSQSIADYHGVWAYFPTSNVSATLDSHGEFNQGEITIPLSFTPGSSPGNTEDGWHCIINPYPSAIDIESSCVEFNNVGSAIYILDHTAGGTWQGEYAVYNNGNSVNGGSKILASYQAIMVQAQGPGAYIRFNECAKTDQQGVFFRSEEQKDLIRFSINQGDNEYESIIAFEEEASAEFDLDLDSRKLSSSSFSIFSLMGMDTLGINTLPMDYDDEISLIVNTPVAGDFNLTVKELLGLEQNMCLTITDTESNEVWNVESGLTIPFSTSQDGYNKVRFKLNKMSLATLEVTQPACHNGQNGLATVELNSENFSEFNWIDESKDILLTESGILSSLEGLSPGVYQVEFNSEEEICGTGVMTFEVFNPKEQVVQINSLPDNCLDESGIIQIQVEEAENWSVSLFEDYQALQSTTSTELTEFTDLKGAVYTAVIETNCLYTEHVIDLADNDQVVADFTAPEEVIILDQQAALQVESLSENASENHWYLDENYLGENDVIPLSFDQPGNYTLTLNSNNEKCEDSYSKEILVSEHTSINEGLAQDLVVLDQPESIEIKLLKEANQALEINLYDANGRLILNESNLSSSSFSITKSGLSRGVYVLEIKSKNSVILAKKILK